jgi:hypothetical protein
MLDEALFSVPGVMDFRVMTSGRQLEILACVAPGYQRVQAAEMEHVLNRIDPICQAKREMGFDVHITVTSNPIPLSAAKRRIEVQESI